MKPGAYYANDRPEMLAFFPAAPGRVLDVGCGGGRFGAMLKACLQGAEVWGVEPIQQAHAAAAQVLDRAILGGFDATLQLPEASFDTVVFNDSLEHFPDAAPPLALARQLLKADGRVIASIPNVRCWSHLKRYVFHAEWQYADEGILDRTHLRFFTYKSIHDTFREAGFRVLRLEGIGARWRGAKLAIARALLPHAVQDLLYLQFAVVAVKADSGAAAAAMPRSFAP
jgi:SAM-dependent methyltransferase